MCPSLGESGGARGTASPISPASARGFVPSRPYTYRSSPYGPHSGTDVGREYSSRHEGRKDGFIRACERFLHQPISRRNGWHKPQDHTCPVVIGEGRRDLLPQRNVTTYRKHPNKHGAGDGVTFSLSRTRQGNCTRFSFAQHTPTSQPHPSMHCIRYARVSRAPCHASRCLLHAWFRKKPRLERRFTVHMRVAPT